MVDETLRNSLLLPSPWAKKRMLIVSFSMSGFLLRVSNLNVSRLSLSRCFPICLGNFHRIKSNFKKKILYKFNKLIFVRFSVSNFIYDSKNFTKILFISFEVKFKIFYVRAHKFFWPALYYRIYTKHRGVEPSRFSETAVVHWTARMKEGHRCMVVGDFIHRLIRPTAH